MATKAGLMKIDRTLAASEAAARATGFMLLRAASPDTGHQEINDEADTGLMPVQTRAISGWMTIGINA